MRIPIAYNLRSLLVRKGSTWLTVLGIAATVAVVAGVLSLQQGFATLYAESGSEDLAVFLRPGATYEGDSLFSRDRALQLVKTCPEIAVEGDRPLASLECFFAVLLPRMDGRETNVPVRGVQDATFLLRPDLQVTEGRRFEPGTDEVIVGRKLIDRVRGCQKDGVLTLNTTPFRVVGVFDSEGPEASEIWGDHDRMISALQRIGPNRILARLKPDVSMTELAERLKDDKQVPAKVLSERTYLSSQTQALSAVLIGLSSFLGLVMGIAAVFTATNTMLAAVAARTNEIGILLACGFRPLGIFLGFLLECVALGLLGGVVGVLLTLPINGIETGTTNFQTFTEVSFGFRTTPAVLVSAVTFSFFLGLLGGALPAWRASRLSPTEALRRQ